METDRTPVDYIEVTRQTYTLLGYQPYRWAHNQDPSPWAPLARPLAELRVGLVASGGVYQHGQVAFTHHDDLTHREVPTDADVKTLRVTHFAFDQTDPRADPNIIFPIEPLRCLVEAGEIGELTSHALTFMGGIYSQRRLREELMPVLVERILELGADAVLLVPV